MLRTRVLTAAIALPAVLAAILFLPNWGFSLLIGILGLWGIYEAFEISGGQPSRVSMSGLVMAVLGLLALVAGPILRGPMPQRLSMSLGFIALLIAAAMIVRVFRVNAVGGEALHADTQKVARIAMLEVGFFFPYFAMLRNGPGGIVLVILMLLLVVCADSGAYFVGRAIGRHKLAFKVSPGKTIEGAIGGILASIAGGLILRGWLVPQWSIVGTVIFSAIIAVLAIIGDLANSAFKRIAGVKDSGWIFPGHGGLLDRTCSLVLAAVFAYYYSR